MAWAGRWAERPEQGQRRNTTVAKRQKLGAGGSGKGAGEEEGGAKVERLRAAQPLLSGPSSSGPVLHGEILPPKPKRSRAVAQPIAGKGITTDVQVKAAGVGVHKIAGATGLTLKIGKSGGGCYVLRYRFAGRRREIGLGSRKDVTLPRR